MTGGMLSATKWYRRPCVFVLRSISISLHVIALGRRMHPGGRIFLLEYHAEDPRVPINPLHKMTAELAVREFEALGFVFVENKRGMPWQHLLVFKNPGRYSSDDVR